MHTSTYFTHRYPQPILQMLLLVSATFVPIAAFADNAVELKPQAPQADTASSATDAESAMQPQSIDSANSSSAHLHKLQINKQSMRDDVDDSDNNKSQSAFAPIQIQSPNIQINAASITIRSGAITTSTGDPLTMMRAIFGAPNKQPMKLYAERDTGYGVCGFLMSIPIGHKGYAQILKCYPSMPAAEADIQVGDLITAVDGQSTKEMPPSDVWNYFTGMPGTTVNIDLLRRKHPYNVTLRRMDIGRIPDSDTRGQFLSLFERNGMSRFVQR